MMKRRRPARQPAPFLTRDELRALLESVKSKRDKAVIMLAYSHGLRVSEVVNLRLADVDMKRGRVTITRNKGSLPSVQPMNATTRRLLVAYLKTRDDREPYLFLSGRAQPLHRSTLLKMMTKHTAALGLPKDKQNFHILKHSIAVHLLEQTGNVVFVKEWLGHAAIQSTTYYAQMVNTQRDAIATSTFSRMGL